MTAADLGAAESYFSHARQEIEPLLPACATRVLEIGCGDGATVAWLKSVRKAGFDAAIERVPEAGFKARSVFDEVEIGSAESAAFSFSCPAFDFILALDVLEHLVDPHQLLRHLHGLLPIARTCGFLSRRQRVNCSKSPASMTSRSQGSSCTPMSLP